MEELWNNRDSSSQSFPKLNNLGKGVSAPELQRACGQVEEGSSRSKITAASMQTEEKTISHLKDSYNVRDKIL